jgi:hypothetical protein
MSLPAVAAVRDQMRSTVRIHVGRAIPGITTPRVTPSDETAVDALADRVHHARLQALVQVTIEPILGLHQAILRHFEDMRAGSVFM